MATSSNQDFASNKNKYLQLVIVLKRIGNFGTHIRSNTNICAKVLQNSFSSLYEDAFTYLSSFSLLPRN
jgi:hypothetical protein